MGGAGPSRGKRSAGLVAGSRYRVSTPSDRVCLEPSAKTVPKARRYEQLWPVPSLDVGAVIDSAPVSLLIERAQAVSPGFSLANADEAAAVVEMCGRLDGIPLAIELAASRMASMTGSDVRDRVDHRIRLLVGSRRGLARHQTLRHAVAWSYDLLDDGEKALLGGR